MNYLTNRKERSSYGLWFVGQNIIYFIVLTYFPIFLTDEVGIGSAAVAILLMVARIWDAVNDPMLGGLVDKTEPKKGKFKPWVDAVSIILPIVTIALFYNFNSSSGFNLTYAYISYIIWGMLYTISDVPIFALATTMTDIPEERVSVISIGRVAAGVATALVGVFAPQIIADLGYLTTAISLMAVALITMLPLRFFVKERVKYKREEAISLKTMFNAVFSNKYLLIFYASYIALEASMTAMTIAPYFAKWNLGNEGILTVIMATLIVPMILIPALLPRLTRKFGKRKVFVVSLAFAIIMSVVQFVAGYESFTIFLIINFFKSIGSFTPVMMMGIFTADCVEYGAYKTGVRNEGVTFSVQTFSTKLGSAFSAALALFTIGYFGYDGTSVTQTQEALDGIWYALILIPLVGMVIALIIFVWKYDLTESDVKEMIDSMGSEKEITNE